MPSGSLVARSPRDLRPRARHDRARGRPASSGPHRLSAVQAISGVGPVMASIFVAEIGDVSRFHSAGTFAHGPGSRPPIANRTPRSLGPHHKQGSNLVRWAAIEAVACYHGGAPIAPSYARVAARRGAMIARVAAARKLLCSSTTAFATGDPLPGRGGGLRGSDTARARARRSPWPPSIGRGRVFE